MKLPTLASDMPRGAGSTIVGRRMVVPHFDMKDSIRQCESECRRMYRENRAELASCLQDCR